MKKSLYNIQQDYLELFENIIEQDGEITEEQEKELAITEEDLREKVTDYSLIILEYNHKKNSVLAEINRLEKIARMYISLSIKLEDSIQVAMERFNIKKIESDLVNISFRQSEYVEIENEVSLPEECFTIHPEERVPNKKKIKELIESGYPLQGASILKRNNLQIK